MTTLYEPAAGASVPAANEYESRPYTDEPLTVSYIEACIRRFESAHADLHRRMDSDLELYELKPYNSNKDGTKTFPSYTSNSPRTYAKRVTALLASAELFIRIPHGVAEADERARYEMKERFLYGLLAAGDERLSRQLRIKVKSQLAWQAALRGYICLRAVLVKDGTGRTFPDILPLDPRTAAWEVGYNGLEWAAYTCQRLPIDIKMQYGVDVGGLEASPREVIDYYDREFNAVIVRGYGFVKPPTRHGCREVPIYIVPVGPTPEIIDQTKQKGTAGYGESIYAENRAVYAARNQAISIYLALVEKARDRSYVLYSPDGATTIEDNPNEAAGVISLPSVARLELVELAETTKDAALFSGVVSEEMHFGSLSKTSYGEVPFQLSGFAINSLRQSVFATLQPLIEAMQDVYTQALNGLADQYATGAYDTLTLSGFGSNRAYFRSEFQPRDLANLPSPVVKLIAALPQDEVGNISMAQQARQGPGGVPLLPDGDILDRIVGVQDVASTQDAIKEQLAERLSPRAMAYTLMEAAEHRGRDELAAIYFGEALIQQLQQMISLAQAKLQARAVGVSPTAVGEEPGSPPGPSPEVLPNAARGVLPPQPTPQAGPLVPPGTERPGAQQTDLERLARGRANY